MKTLKIIGLYTAAGILFAPCLCIFNEQPDGVPQHWYVNLFGLAYACGLYLAGKRIFKSKER